MPAKEVLQALIQNFSTENLIQLFRNKSNKFRLINEDENQHNNEFFSKVLRFGEIKLDNDEELIIYTFNTTKDLTERSGKKAQYELSKKILKQEQRYSAGFFIFYDVNSNFRLSLVYDTPQPNGKREWSNFKRFTYYVSKAQTNKTFLYRLESADFSSLEKIKEAFSVEKVTKEFYTEIANWYFWALKNVEFPKDAEIEKNGKNIALIRFITRIIFIWFMKQKNLIKNVLFDKNEIRNILKTLADRENTYYKAILQNLFFATLNTPITERKFRRDKEFQGKNKDYMNHNYYRYHNLFNNPDDMLSIFKDIPFLNGGLFECLDKRKDDPSNYKGEEIRIDGFSDRETNQTIFPNFLFFSDECEVDLNKDYGTTNKRYKTRGLINILQSYNFTIDENTPTDEEIALDPELLGRVFENLLASYNPETASTARKATGSYYTPREIVNYMVDESLIAYLKNKVIEGAKSYIQLGTEQSDMFGNTARIGQLKLEEELLPSRWIDNEEELEKELRKLISYSDDSISFTDKETDILINAINNCKILDPAVGSGAFPMGVLHKLVLILSKLDPHNNKWKQQQITAIESNVTDPKLKRILIDKIEESFSCNELDYGRKLYLIQNCLYGVDIQPIAIQIAKLRFFISLLVDEKVNPGKVGKNFGIEPLPNLETKLVAANTLIGLPQTLTLRPRELEKLENELFDLRRKYFITSSETEKKTLEKNDRELRQKIKFLLDENQFPAELAEKISKWDPYNTNIAADWFDPEWMFGPEVKDGFDVVIANPPYVRQEKIKDLKEKLTLIYISYTSTADLFTYFYERGIKLLNHKGTLIFISSSKFFRSDYGQKLRKFIATNCKIKMVIDFGELPVFEANTFPTIIHLERNENIYDNNIFVCKVNELSSLSNLNGYINQKGFLLDQSFIEVLGWNFENKALQVVRHKIKINGVQLKSILKRGILLGIKTGLNKAFVLNQKEYEQLIKLSPESEEIIVPYLKGDDIRRYRINYSSEYLILSKKGIEIEKYKTVLNHLKKYKAELSKRTDIRNNGKWYELRSCSYYDEFEREKIAFPEIGMETRFALVPKGIYFRNSAHLIPSNDRFLLALLNSSIANFFFKMECDLFGEVGEGGRMMFREIYVERFPIPLVSEGNKKEFIDLVDQIIEAKKQNPQVVTKHLEDQIDIMVYKLYNLTYEEVKIIDTLIEKIISQEEYEKFEIN